MLDSNVYDLVAANTTVRNAILNGIGSGRLTLVSTHVQRDELTRAPETRRESLLEIHRLAEIVQTSGAVWDVSPFDESAFGTDVENDSITSLIGGNPRHAEDALIASTAASAADVLVTNEARLASKIQRTGFGVSIWQWDQFVAWLCHAKD